MLIGTTTMSSVKHELVISSNILQILPIEIIIKIVSFLDYPDITSLTKLSKYWNKLLTKTFKSYLLALKKYENTRSISNWFQFNLKPDLITLYQYNFFKNMNILPMSLNQPNLYNNYTYIYGFSVKHFELMQLLSKLIVKDRLSKFFYYRPSIDELISRQILRLPYKYHKNYFYYYNDLQTTDLRPKIKILKIQKKLLFNELIDSFYSKFKRKRLNKNEFYLKDKIQKLIKLYENDNEFNFNDSCMGGLKLGRKLGTEENCKVSSLKRYYESCR